MRDRPRFVIETPCEHGETSPHLIEGTDREVVFEAWTYLIRDECPGGSRRVIEPGSFVLVEKNQDGEWPEWALRILGQDVAMLAECEPPEILDTLAVGER